MLLTISTETIIFLGVVLILFIWIVRLELRLRRLTKGADGKSLEGNIRKMGENITSLEEFRSEVRTYLDKVEKRLSQSIQGTATVRFDAFSGTGEGGRQSFATAFIDENGDGVVLSSLYRRDNIGVFAKPIKRNFSVYGLTEEEKEVLKKAQDTLVS